jgi:hypothetical protein
MDEPGSSPRHEWLPTECAPKRYPVQLLHGDLIFGDGGVYIPDGRLVKNGWGEIGSTHIVGEDVKPLPTTLDLTWLSYAEDVFYSGEFTLDHDRLADMFTRGLQAPTRDERAAYGRIIVGMAPGGLISVWLAGAGIVHEVEAFTAQPCDVPWEEFAGQGVDRDEFIREGLLRVMSQAELDHLTEHGIPSGLYARYRKQYVWSVQWLGRGAPQRAWVRALNGERDLIRFDRPAARPTMAVPRQIDLEWTEEDRSYCASIPFDEIEAMTAFEDLTKMDVQRPLIVQLAPTRSKPLRVSVVQAPTRTPAQDAAADERERLYGVELPLASRGSTSARIQVPSTST